MKIAEILTRSSNGEPLDLSQAGSLMAIEPDTVAFYWLLATAGQKATGNNIHDKMIAVHRLSEGM